MNRVKLCLYFIKHSFQCSIHDICILFSVRFTTFVLQQCHQQQSLAVANRQQQNYFFCNTIPLRNFYIYYNLVFIYLLCDGMEKLSFWSSSRLRSVHTCRNMKECRHLVVTVAWRVARKTDTSRVWMRWLARTKSTLVVGTIISLIMIHQA